MAALRDEGVMIIQAYASAIDASKSEVLQNFIARYGDAQLEILGKAYATLSFPIFREKVLETESGKSKSVNPAVADILGAIIAAGGEAVDTSVLGAVKAGVSESVEEFEDAAVEVSGAVFSGIKYVAVAAIVVGLAYLAYQMGWLKNVARRR